jgi:hypothetical protein
MDFRQIESGPTFEIYEGPTCVMRVDWTHAAFRAIYVGHIAAACAAPLIKRSEAMVRAGQAPFALFHDAWGATGYESGMRVEMTQWTEKNRGTVKELHMLTQSKILSMAVAVIGLTLPGLMKGYSKRQDFDVLVKRAGLPLNPSMPDFSPAPIAGMAR